MAKIAEELHIKLLRSELPNCVEYSISQMEWVRMPRESDWAIKRPFKVVKVNDNQIFVTTTGTSVNLISPIVFLTKK